MRFSVLDKKFRRDVIISYCTQIAGLMLAFSGVTLITNVGGVALYGLIATLTALSAVVSNLASFRTNEAIVRFYKKGELEDSASLKKFTLLIGFFIDAIAACVIYGLISAYSDFVAHDLLKNASLSEVVRDYSFVVVLVFVRGTAVGYLSVVEKFALVNYLTLSEHFFKLIGLFFFYGRDGNLSLQSVVMSHLFSAAIVTTLFLVFPIKAIFFEFRNTKIRFDGFNEYIRFSGSTFLSSMIKAGNQNIDTLLISYINGPASAGLYGLFKQFLTPVHMLSQPFSSQIYPRLVKFVEHKEYASVVSEVKKLSLVLQKGFAGVAIFIIPLFYVYSNLNGISLEPYDAAAFLLAVMNGLVVQQLWWARPFSLATDPKISLVGNMLALIVLPLSVLLLASRFGLIGAIAGVITSNLIVTAYYRYKFRSTCIAGF